MVENILIEVLASIAENERNTTRQRQREGIEAAQMKGKHLGRPKLKIPDNFSMVYQQWKENEFTAKEVRTGRISVSKVSTGSGIYA